MEEEGEIQRGHQLKLLSEVLVLSLREKRPSLSHLLVAKVEAIIVQTKLSNSHDLLFGLPFLPDGDQLLHHLLGISLQELGAACRMNANGGVETGIRASQLQSLLRLLNIPRYEVSAFYILQCTRYDDL